MADGGVLRVRRRSSQDTIDQEMASLLQGPSINALDVRPQILLARSI